MWKALGGALTAAMLVAGGTAQANDRAPKETGTGAEVEKQSGEEGHPLSQIEGESARILQEKLKAEGFYEGEVDGILGPKSQQALMKFQESKGLTASGKLDNQTASALGIEISDVQPVRGEEPAATPKDDTEVTDETEIETQAGTTLDKETIRQVEEALKTKNLFTGKVDGVIEADTTNAIRRFQSENGITVTGRLDVQTLNALGVKVPDTMKGTPTPEGGATPIGTPSEPIDD